MYLFKAKFFFHTIIFLGLTFILPAEASVRENLRKITSEIQNLIDSTKTSVVTVAARFSHEVAIEKEGGFLSFFKAEHSKKSVSYVNIGTGIVFDLEGHIVTRSSVVYGAESNKIIFFDGTELDAKFIGRDDRSGFAVLKVVAEALQPAKLGKADDLKPGALNILLGNTLGIYPSFTLCWINAVRPDGMLQISAGLNPGNTGSPIINHNGEVIAQVAGLVHPESNMNYHFDEAHLDNTTLAVPINLVSRVASDIINYGRMRRGWLGVVGYDDGWKPKVRTVKKDSPAMHAGLEVGDVIVSFSEKEINHISDLVRLVEYMPPGQVVPLQFLRDGELRQVNLEIGEKVPSKVDSLEYGYFSASNIKSDPAEPLLLGTLNLVERNRMLEKRVEELERQIAELRKIVESY